MALLCNKEALLMRPPSPPRPSAPECYFRDIDQTPLLSPDEERALARRIAEGDAEARDHLTRANLRLVVCIAKAYAGKGLGLEDLIAEGNLGLLRAVEGYDPSMNTRFSTYASYWVKQSIRRALVNTGRTVRIPVYMSQLVAEWRREAARLEDELGRPPAEGEVAAALGLSPRKLKLVRKALRVHNSGRPSGTEHVEGLSVDDTFLDDRAAAPEAAVSAAEDVRQVLDGLDALGGRAAAVLRLRYGLGGEEPLTLQEVG